MKVTKRQLGKIIKEVRMAQGGFMALKSRADPEFASLIKGQRKLSEYTRDPMERAYARHVEDYEAWVKERGHITPASSSVLATYLIDQRLDQNIERVSLLTSEYRMDKTDVSRQLATTRAEYEAGGIESEEDNYERGFFREGSREGVRGSQDRHEARDRRGGLRESPRRKAHGAR